MKHFFFLEYYFFVLEIITFLYYANEEGQDVVNGSSKTVKHGIKNISRIYLQRCSSNLAPQIHINPCSSNIYIVVEKNEYSSSVRISGDKIAVVLHEPVNGPEKSYVI